MIVFLASVAGAKTKTVFETPTTDAAFEKIVGELKTQAKTFAETADDKAPLQSKIVAKIRYSPKSSAPLIKTLKALSGKPPTKLYITYQLLVPMEKASDETIRPLVPLLINMLSKDCVHESMPKWPRFTLDKLKPLKKKDSPERKKLRIAALAKKTAAERAVVKHNRTVNALEKTAKRLLALYDRLKTMAFKDNKQRRYSDPTKPVYKTDKNSSFLSARINFSVSAIEVVNVLATSAKQPAVKLPGTKPPKKRPRKRPRR
jgi:hypothetical protein